MIVSVIGLGYIGLPTAAILASHGIKVLGVDNNKSVVEAISQGLVQIAEPGLDEIVEKVVKAGRLEVAEECKKADVFMIAVPTPFTEGHKPDLSYIESAIKAISPVLEKGNLIILESTSPVGTTEKMAEWIRIERPDLFLPEFGGNGEDYDISIAYCPERVLPGQAIHELIENDRIIGGMTSQCTERAREVYKVFVKAACLATDCRTAELSKLVENSYRDVNIAFANEMSIICDKLGVNVWEMISLANRHPRVEILQPGPGVGGHCIAVDPWFIVDSAPNESTIIKAARTVNDSKPSFILEKVNHAIHSIGKKRSSLTIACLGLSFKADIDDLRESPALDIARQVDLMNFNKLLLVDPNISRVPEGFKNVKGMSSTNSALKAADIVLLLVDHKQFKSIEKNLLIGKKVIDTKGIWRTL